MVNNNEQLSTIFSALSDPTRRAMLTRLAGKEMSVAELAEPFPITKSAVTKHIKMLEKAGLLQRSIQGRVHQCRINVEPLQQASEWMQFYEQFWDEKLIELDKFLMQPDEQGMS
ncbi:MAG: ArsR/SmtB family transcription factor [Thiolinea sp.]